jgi:glycosyltransferase involved in cell wall biosynthesis
VKPSYLENGGPLVTVLLCNYNYGQFIAEAIESVLNQSYSKFEFLIVDDGSTDISREVIATYDDPRIRVILQENGGQAAAFNAGFALASGEIVAFLDSDDWWKQGKLETIVRWHHFLEGDYALLQHGLDVWEDGNTRPYKLILPVGDCFAEMQRSGRLDFFVPTSGLCFRRAILDRVLPMPRKFRIAADAYLMRTTFVFGKVHSIHDSLGFYRRHNNLVLGNRHFHRTFIAEVLIPELNRFYRTQGIDYQIDRPRPHRLGSRIRMLVCAMLRRSERQLAARRMLDTI